MHHERGEETSINYLICTLSVNMASCFSPRHKQAANKAQHLDYSAAIDPRSHFTMFACTLACGGSTLS